MVSLAVATDELLHSRGKDIREPSQRMELRRLAECLMKLPSRIAEEHTQHGEGPRPGSSETTGNQRKDQCSGQEKRTWRLESNSMSFSGGLAAL